MGKPNWGLKDFEVEGVAFICCFIFYVVFNFLFWNTFVLKPIKLIATFCYELNHLIVCRLTGGKTEKIQLYNAEGDLERGLTKFEGGVKICVIPAGYIGNAFWGTVFVAFSGNRIASTIITSLFICVLITSLKYAPSNGMKLMTVIFIIGTALAIFIDWFLWNILLAFVTLYYGISIGTYAIYSDLRRNNVRKPGERRGCIFSCKLNGPDAKACHDAIPCCLTRCVALQFIFSALAMQILGVYLALVWIHSPLKVQVSNTEGNSI